MENLFIRAFSVIKRDSGVLQSGDIYYVKEKNCILFSSYWSNDTDAQKDLLRLKNFLNKLGIKTGEIQKIKDSKSVSFEFEVEKNFEEKIINLAKKAFERSKYYWVVRVLTEVIVEQDCSEVNEINVQVKSNYFESEFEANVFVASTNKVLSCAKEKVFTFKSLIEQK